MEFACSHVVCNWQPVSDVPALYAAVPSGSYSSWDGSTQSAAQGPSSSSYRDYHDYDNRIAVIPRSHQGYQDDSSLVPPPLPPRQGSCSRTSQRHQRPQSLPLPSSAPPPLPPRVSHSCNERNLKANVNVVSVSVGRLVDITKAADIQQFQNPFYCKSCQGSLSALSVPRHRQQGTVWCCEFCGQENVLPSTASHLSHSRDVLYVSEDMDGDYINLEDMLVVFCVDISGSMSVTDEVSTASKAKTPLYISRLQSVQDALLKSLNSLLKTSPRRRVALVTFNDEVTVYGDGTTVPLTLRDWGLMDYDHLKSQGENFTTPHCIAESILPLSRKVQEMKEHGATALGPAALISIAMASRYMGSKVIICTDGRANIGLGDLEEEPTPSSSYFYSRLAEEASAKGVIVSVLTFKGTDCRLVEVGTLADRTGGKVNIVNISNVSSEIQSLLKDNIIATSVKATLLSADGIFYPYEDHCSHKLVKEVGNVTEGLEITFEFAVKPSSVESFLRRDRLPFQLQLDFKTRELQKATRILTEQRRVTTSSWVWTGSLNMSVLGVHCAQLCARLTMEGRVLEAQRQLQAQQELLKQISDKQPNTNEESVYGNWISTMSHICEDLTENTQRSRDLPQSKTVPVKGLSDEAANVVYQMKRAKSIALRRHPSDTLGL
ncbi:circularly permutated Ras protein 1 [Lepisosteus oculatus]|uniref:circularly permutated Ras protein 1 n=1 Tax=Lepisosteus oculatus TaxID=7918 RepID=UPI0035F51810